MNKSPRVPRASVEVTKESILHHKKWAEFFRRAKWVVLIFLLLFSIIMLFFFKNSINYQNFMFLLRDLDVEYNADANIGGIGVFYDADTDMTCRVFKNHLIVIDTGHVFLYGLSGYRVFSYAHDYQNPHVAVSDNYFIVYDLGGYQFSFYNAIGLLYESAEYDYQILDAHVADNGHFAILTKNQTYRSTVQVFNKNQDLLAAYHTMRYVTRIAFNDNAKQIQIASVYVDVDDGVPRTVLQSYQVGSKQEVFHLEYPKGDTVEGIFTASSVIPLDVASLNSHSIAVLCNNGVIFSSSLGKMKNFFSFFNDLSSDVGNLSTAAYGEDQIALLFLDKVNESERHLCILDDDGKIILEQTLSLKDAITHMSYDQDTLFLLSSSHAYKLEKNGKLSSIALAEHNEIMGFSAYNSSTVIISYIDKTISVTFE